MLSHAYKSLRRAPGLALAAVLCLALGAAATSAVATLVGALLLRPLPFPDADRLVRLWFEEPGGDSRISLSIPEFDDFKQVRAFDAFVGTARVRAVALFGSGAKRLYGEGVSPRYFELLGVRPHLGRLLMDSDHAASTSPALVLSYGAWARLFGSDAGVVGRELRTARAVYTIVGVAEPGFDGSVEDDVVEFFVPIEHYEPRTLQTDRMGRSAWAIARLAPGLTVAHADAEVAGMGRTLAARFPAIYGRYRARVEPLGESWRERLRSGAGLLFLASGVLLVIAAINVGCLLLARVLERRRELAIRAALGADLWRMTAQLFVEAMLLVIVGGAAGAVVGPWLLDAFLALSLVALPHYVTITPDLRTMAISIGALALAGLMAGTAPALVGRRAHPGEVLRESGRGTLGRVSERRWTTMLIAGETALTLVLLVSGGLLLRSFDRLNTADLGFDRQGIARLAVTLNVTDVGDTGNLPALYERLHQAIAAAPGVRAVGLVAPTLPPWDGERSRVTMPGVELPPDSDGLTVGTHFADRGLLPMLGAEVVAGRNLSASDGDDATPVVVVSESLARLVGGPERALGRTVRFAPSDARASDREFRVVGVVEDVAYDGMVEQNTQRFLASSGFAGAEARYDVYFSLAQTPTMVVSIGAATTGDAAALIAPLREIINTIAPASAVHWTSAMEDEIALEYAPSRFYSVIVVMFSLSALMLTSLGLFALLSHAAAQRMSEMGLRLALGATPQSTAALLLRTGLMPLVAGIAGGLVGAAAASRFIQGMLYGVAAFDILTFAAAVTTLLAVTLAAALIPARRVAAADPITTLRAS
jgi:predicted permease